MLDQPAMRRRCRAAWVVMLALVIGVGLIAMHSGVAHPEHEHSTAHGHALDAVGQDASHAPACEGCESHSSVMMACAVLLAAVAGRVAVRVLRRLGGCVPLVRVASSGPPGWLRTAVGALARPPDLHALQVMRC